MTAEENFNRSFEKVFELEEKGNTHVVVTTTNSTNALAQPIEATDNREEEDFEFARQNIKNAIEQGTKSLEDLVNFTKFDETPRNYEVLTNSIKNLVDSNEKLLDIHKKHKEIKAEDSNPHTVHNTLVMTTEDVRKQIAESRKKKHG